MNYLFKRALTPLLFTFILFVYTFPYFGQSQTSNALPNVVPPSPNAAALGKYGDIPVSYSTGIPSISIPLCAVSGKALSLPISLSYHASGVKVDEMASNVGLGWSLSAGGVITRSIVGLPDEQYFQESFNPTNTENLMRAATGTLDAQPDAFYFNVNAFSGKFYIDKNATDKTKRVKLVSHQDLSITCDDELKTFTLTTPDGTVYRFGGGDLEQFVEKSSSYRTCDGSRPMIPEAISTWHLREIEHITGEKISFTYVKEIIQYAQGVSETNVPKLNFYLLGELCMNPNTLLGVKRCKSYIAVNSKKIRVIHLLT